MIVGVVNLIVGPREMPVTDFLGWCSSLRHSKGTWVT